jgi:predicted MPP superfamily phosphohydrolase
LSRRNFLKHLAATVAAPLAAGLHARHIEPYWVEYHDVPLPIPGLPPALSGLRLAHLTDLHAGSDMPFAFLQRVVAEVRRAGPDLVLITGDLVTNAQQDWFDPVAALLAGFGRPTFVTFGNHDYGIYTPGTAHPGDVVRYRWSADVLEHRLMARGVVVLRNRAVRVVLRDTPLWLVGLDDLWGGYFKPELAFAHVPADQLVITLSHNPDTGPKLLPYQPQCILAGHTHGGQVRLPFVGAPIVPVRNKQFDRGLFHLDPPPGLRVPPATMYVSRGIGYLRKIRFLCRPELPTFVLEPSA